MNLQARIEKKRFETLEKYAQAETALKHADEFLPALDEFYALLNELDDLYRERSKTNGQDKA